MPISDEPAEVWFRPRGAHLLYLLGICAVLIAVAELIHRRSVRVLVVFSVGIAVTVSAAIAQSPLPSAADESRFAAWVEHPEGVQSCSRHAGVAYCAYPGYDQLIPRWRAPVEGVLSLAPDSVRTRSLMIRQRVPSERVQLLRPTLRAALSFPVAPNVPFWWPDDGAIHPDLHWCETGLRRARCEMILGNTVAAWVVGLPLVRVGPPATRQAQAAAIPFEAVINQGLYDSSGQARAVVALWLTIEATPRTRTASPSFDASLSRYPMNTCSATGEGPESSVTWSLLDTGYARRLAELPVADVAARLRSRWNVVTDPHTTTAQLAKLMNLPGPSAEMLRPLAINEGC
jgi:hypothetical protein